MKPHAVKGQYVKSISVSATMSPGRIGWQCRRSCQLSSCRRMSQTITIAS